MCGIAGIVGFPDSTTAAAEVEVMKSALRHRGPDGEGTWLDGERKVALGHRRLAIIDLSPEANQPMHSVDGRFVVAFNGEIYNYRELRKECEALGSRFHTHSDTEVLIESVRHWGAGALVKFRGMWAFVLYDRVNDSLLFSRDPLGIKPLYYAEHGGALYFASEPKALRAALPVLNEIDDVTLSLFMEHGYLDRGDWTFFRRIKRFPHAHFAQVKPGERLRFERYWTPPADTIRIGMREAAAEVARLLKRSVELHLRSDVPVGSCLSGGIDSSAIVALGTRLMPPGQAFNTFTTHYPDHPEIDETEWAKQIIDANGTNAIFIEPTYETFARDFNRMVEAQDEPFGTTSIYAQFRIFQGISETPVRVVLDGQGADEMFGGYHGYIPYYLRDRLAKRRSYRYLHEVAWLRGTLRKGISLREQDLALPWKVWLQGLLKPPIPVAPLTVPPAGRFEPRAGDEELNERLTLLRLPEDSFEQILVNLTTEQNLQQLLRYEDRNSMAFSIESRVPFVETDLVSFVLSLPADLKIQRGFTKAVLREALRGVLPEAVRTRRSKLGFPTPEVAWLSRGFGFQAKGAGSLEWRKLITNAWKEGLSKEPSAR